MIRGFWVAGAVTMALGSGEATTIRALSDQASTDTALTPTMAIRSSGLITPTLPPWQPLHSRQSIYSRKNPDPISHQPATGIIARTRKAIIQLSGNAPAAGYKLLRNPSHNNQARTPC